MPLVTPPTVDVGMVREDQRRKERAMARVAGPMKVGCTLYKDADGWHQGRHISNSVLTAAETVLLGGHWYSVGEDTLAEIIADGITPISIAAAYPSSTLYPSSSTLPGA